MELKIEDWQNSRTTYGCLRSMTSRRPGRNLTATAVRSTRTPTATRSRTRDLAPSHHSCWVALRTVKPREMESERRRRKLSGTKMQLFPNLRKNTTSCIPLTCLLFPYLPRLLSLQKVSVGYKRLKNSVKLKIRSMEDSIFKTPRTVILNF